MEFYTRRRGGFCGSVVTVQGIRPFTMPEIVYDVAGSVYLTCKVYQLAAEIGENIRNPVAFWPGCGRFSTKPMATGLPTAMNMIGTTELCRFAATDADEPQGTKSFAPRCSN